MPALAEFENLVKVYGSQQALGPLTLSLPEGSVGLLGPNGSGKTTLLRIVMALLPPTSGAVRVLGEEVKPGSKEIRRKIGYVPEGEARFPGRTGVEAVALAGRLVGMSKVDALQRAHQVIDYVGLGEARYRSVDTYSTGMRQRLKLAQALVHDPELLILDEPTEGVDPEARTALLELIAELEREHGVKLLLSTHLLHDVERIATHVLVLHEGRAVAHGAIADLKSASSRAYVVRLNGPLEPFTRALEARSIAWEPAPPGLRVNAEDPKLILRVASDAGLVIRHLAPVEQSLEEAFTQAVGGANVA